MTDADAKRRLAETDADATRRLAETDADATRRLAEVRERIARAARDAGRSDDEITLVGVCKRQPEERIVAAVAAGLRHLGESFAQEARDRREALDSAWAARQLPPPRWHFVGQLQRNKARLVAPDFDVVETVDRMSLAEELDKRAAASGRTLEVLLQVNLSNEPQKGGAPEVDLVALLDASAALPHLRVTGLMTVPAASEDPEASRAAFAHLRELRDRLRQRPSGDRLVELSMGMSGDFEVAIAEGATIVRVGTAVFGPREGTT